MNETATQSEIKTASKWAMVWGVVLIGIGLVAIVVPAIASVATAIFIGWILVFAGAVTFVEAFSAGNAGRAAVRVVLALLTAGVGIYLLVEPLRGTYTLTVMLVIWFVAVGIFRLVLGLANLGQPGASLLALNGVVSLVLGVLIGNNLPSSADWAIGLLVGIDMIFAGATAIGVHSALKRSGELPPPPSTPAFA